MTTIVSLPAKPTRSDLRAALRTLTPLASISDDAAEELAAVQKIIKDLYPRRTAGTGISRRGTGKKKRRRLIEAQDVMCTCQCCRGIGRVPWFVKTREDAAAVLMRHPAMCPPGAAEDLAQDDRFPGLICPECNGTGKVVGGTIHHVFEVYGCKRWRERCSLYEPGPMHDVPVGPAFVHSRGYLNGSQVGHDRPELCRLRASWNRKPDEPDDPALVGMPLTPFLVSQRVQPSAADLSAEAEARARNWFKAATVQDGPRGKKQKSRRDKTNLTPDQERRVKMERRVEKMNRMLARKAAKCIHDRRNHASADAIAALKRMGIDVVAAMARVERDPPPFELDSPTIAEARRRGDLPVDDAPLLPIKPDVLGHIDHARVVAVMHGARYVRFRYGKAEPILATA